MDIAKYIGLFLLKNNFCYIHGLGNLQLIKKPATYDGQALQAPSYEVMLTPGGSIDDNLANFIATAEQISISKAANTLRDYSTQARVDLQQGKEVIIPSLGKFVEEDGTIIFITDPALHYTPPGIPVLKIRKEIEEQKAAKDKAAKDALENAAVLPPVPQEVIPEPKKKKQRQELPPLPVGPAQQPVEPAPADYPPYPEEKKAIHWPRVLLIIAAVIVVVGIAIWGIQYINSHNTPPPAVVMPKHDTVTRQAAVVMPPAPQVDNTDTPRIYKFVINKYGTKYGAQNRIDHLTELGKDVAIISDSVGYLVYMNVICKPADTTQMADSLRKLYNPKKSVYIYKQSVADTVR